MRIIDTSLQSFSTRLAQLIRKNEVVFLVGAGVSMVPPTNLPSGPALKHAIVSAVCSLKLLRGYSTRLLGNPRYAGLVPEVIVERIFEITGSRTYSAFDLFKQARPNRLHRCLAKIATTHQCAIFTTNFDVLIEQTAPASVPTVLHLHGKVGGNEPLGVRLNAIGRGFGGYLARAFRKAVARKTICILGYSGNDEDIRRAMALSEAKAVLWLVRDRSDSAIKNLAHFGTWDVPCLVATGDLQRLAGFLSCLGASAGRGTPVLAVRGIRRSINRWQQSMTTAERHACLSKWFIDCEDYGAAQRVAQAGFAHARQDGWSCWFKNQESWAARMSGDIPGMKRLALAGLKASRSEKNAYEEAHALNQLGLSYLEARRPNPGMALPLFREAAKVMRREQRRAADAHRREQVDLSLAQFLNNLGLTRTTLGRTASGLNAYRQSLILKRRHGALFGISQTSINICHTHYRAKRWAQAHAWRRRAEHFIQRYDLRFQHAYLLRELGAIATNQGRWPAAKRLLLSAIDVYKTVPGARFGREIAERQLTQVEALAQKPGSSPR